MSTSLPLNALDVELDPGRPPVLHVETPDDVSAWATRHRQALRATVAQHGCVLVRGLGLTTTADVAAVYEHLTDGLTAEREAFAERQVLGEGLYSSVKWPPTQPMCMHHELSYRLEVPGLLLFACLTAPTSGGVTAVADAAAVLEALPADLVDRFEREGWVLMRSFNDEIGATVEEAFGTDDRDAVEDYCRRNAIETDWQPDGGLRTRQRRPAVVVHPTSGRRCWFNQVAFLNEWTMAEEVREYLVDVYGVEGLPFNTEFGDGEPVGPDVVRLINDTYDGLTRREPWQVGDLMLVDNIATAHSREPYKGPREVVVGLAEPLRLPQPPAAAAGGGS